MRLIDESSEFINLLQLLICLKFAKKDPLNSNIGISTHEEFIKFEWALGSCLKNLNKPVLSQLSNLKVVLPLTLSALVLNVVLSSENLACFHLFEIHHVLMLLLNLIKEGKQTHQPNLRRFRDTVNFTLFKFNLTISLKI
jgi:hypothetical protein